MAKFQNPGAFFLGTLVAQEQKFLKPLIENARKQGYTRFVEPCAGAFAMSHIAAQCGYKPSEMQAILGRGYMTTTLPEIAVGEDFIDTVLPVPAAQNITQTKLPEIEEDEL